MPVSEVPRFLLGFSQDFLGTLMRAQQRFGDVVHIKAPNLLLVFSLDEARRIMIREAGDYRRSAANFRAVEKILGQNLQILEGQVWEKARRKSEPFYTDDYFGPRLDTADQIISETLENLKARQGQPVDVHQEVQQLTMRIVNALYLGIDDTLLTAVSRDYMDFMARNYMPLAAIRGWNWIRYIRPQSARLDDMIVARFESAILRSIEAYRADCTDDNSTLLAYGSRNLDTEEFPFSESDLMDHARGILLGSNLGLGLSVMWAIYKSCETPGVQDRIQSALRTCSGKLSPTEMSRHPFMRAVQMESLRLLPPAHSLMREPTVGKSIGGINVKAGTPILIGVHAIQNDSRHWPQPDAFIPERFVDTDPSAGLGAFLPFGLGQRVCIARQLSLTIGALVIGRFFEAFDARAMPGFKPVIKLTPEISTENGMWLELQPR